MIRTRPVEELLGPFFLQMSITRMFDNNRQVNISDRVLLFISLRVIYIYFYFIPFFCGRNKRVAVLRESRTETKYNGRLCKCRHLP